MFFMDSGPCRKNLVPHDKKAHRSTIVMIVNSVRHMRICIYL